MRALVVTVAFAVLQYNGGNAAVGIATGQINSAIPIQGYRNHGSSLNGPSIYRLPVKASTKGGVRRRLLSIGQRTSQSGSGSEGEGATRTTQDLHKSTRSSSIFQHMGRQIRSMLTSEPGNEPIPKPQTESQPEPETEPHPESEAEPHPEPETEPRPESEAEPRPDPETEPRPESKAEPHPDPETEPERDASHVSDAERNSAIPEPESPITLSKDSSLDPAGKLNGSIAKPNSSIAESEPTPEGGVKYDNRTTATSEREPSPNAVVEFEPTPLWPEALRQWKVAWPLHNYGFGCLFLGIGLHGLVIMIAECRKPIRSSVALTFTCLLAVFGWSRAACHMIDAYNQQGVIPPLAYNMLWSAGGTAITGGFLVFLSLLEDISGDRLKTAKYASFAVMIRSVLFQSVLEMSTDVAMTYTIKAKVLVMICQVYYFCTGLFICASFAIVVYKLNGQSKRNGSISGGTVVPVSLVRLAVLSSLLGLVLSVMIIYSASSVFGVYSDIVYVEAWPWWVLQTAMRSIELQMAVTAFAMHYIVKTTAIIDSTTIEAGQVKTRAGNVDALKEKGSDSLETKLSLDLPDLIVQQSERPLASSVAGLNNPHFVDTEL